MKCSGMRLGMVLGVCMVAMALPRSAEAWWAPEWSVTHGEYTVGDYVRTGHAWEETFECIQTHTSTEGRKPPNPTYWEHRWPKDPPSLITGEGLTGDDYKDFGGINVQALHYRREIEGNTQNYLAPIEYVPIEADNDKIDPDHCRTAASAGDTIRHLHFLGDYGTWPHETVTVQEGHDYFDYVFRGYTPTPQSVGAPTVARNCVCYAYNSYGSTDNKANFWVNSNADANPYRDDEREDAGRLYVIASTGENALFDTVSGDRCDNGATHVWKVEESDVGCPAWMISWKTNSSAKYIWTSQEPCMNDAPQGNLEGGAPMYESYAIYNATDR